MHGYYFLIILFFIVAGLAAAIWNGRNIIRKNKTSNWPHTDATIFYNSDSNSAASIPEIYFRYSVSDKDYEQKIEPTPSEETAPGFVDHFKSKYPDNSKIKIYYQPDSPENTCFTVGASTEDKLIFWISIGAILMGLYAITV